MPPRIKRQYAHIFPNRLTQLPCKTCKAQCRVTSAVVHDHDTTASQSSVVRTHDESARRELDLQSLLKVLPVRVRTNGCVLRIGLFSCGTSCRYSSTKIKSIGIGLRTTIKGFWAYEDGGPILLGQGSEPSESATSSTSSYSSPPSDDGRFGNFAIRALMAERYSEDMFVSVQLEAIVLLKECYQI